MFPFRPLVAAIALATCSVATAAPDNNYTPRSLLSQAKGLPSDFEEHFFDVPLAVRVERDQQLVGEAMIVLTRDDRITLLEFTDHSDSPITGTERDTWENSLVSILTENAERDAAPQQFYTQPDGGSTGLIINNQLNLNGGQNQDLGGRFGIEASSSLGNWSQTLNFQLARLGGPDTQLYHALYSAYAQREFEGQFLRLGYFTPNSEGLNRQPRSFGAAPDLAVGVMVGSSDSLAMNNPKPSIYPIYVTANRQASVEVYRNGLLINTQAVPAGLQTLDTRPLPHHQEPCVARAHFLLRQGSGSRIPFQNRRRRGAEKPCGARMNRARLQSRLSAAVLLCVLVLLSFSAIAAREEAVFHVSVKVPTSDFFVLPLNPGFLEREQVMHYNLVTGRLSPLRETFEVKNALGGINARLGFAPVLSNGAESIALDVSFNGHRLDVVDTLVVPEAEAKVGKRVPLVIAAQPRPDEGYLPGQYYGSVQIIFDALRP